MLEVSLIFVNLCDFLWLKIWKLVQRLTFFWFRLSRVGLKDSLIASFFIWHDYAPPWDRASSCCGFIGGIS